MNKKPVCCPSGEQINILAASTANALSQGKSSEEVDLLSSLFSLIGDALGVIVASRALCEAQNVNEIETTSASTSEDTDTEPSVKKY